MLSTKFLVLLLCSTVGAELLTRSVNVQGPIFGNAIWTQANSPYIVTGDFQVPSNVALTLEPGTQVIFSGDFQILIKGRINVQGTPMQPVPFTGSNGRKSMLLFRSTDLSASVINYAQFTGPQPAIQLAAEGEHSQDAVKNSGQLRLTNIALANSKIRTNGYQSTASLSIERATITSSTIVGVYPSSEPISISDSTIHASEIRSDSYNYGIRINTSTIAASSFFIGCCGANIEVNNSKIAGVEVTEGGGSPVNGPFRMGGCTGDGLSINLPGAKVGISNSRLTLGTQQSIRVGIANIQCSQISGDQSQVGIEITGRDGYYPSSVEQTILRSSLWNFATAVSVTGDQTTLTVDRTNLFANSQYNIYNTSPRDIVATNNYWGVNGVDAALAQVFDYFKDIDSGKVLLDPMAPNKMINGFC